MNGLGRIPDVVKNLLIINGLFYLATIIAEMQGIKLVKMLGMYYIDSSLFEPYQIITSMFMHGGFYHILFNMFGLWMFGSVLERVWGPKRFLLFYLLTGLGASFLHQFANAFEVYQLLGTAFPGIDAGVYPLPGSDPEKLYAIINFPVVGASGAISGLLMAFAVLFPNTELMLIFFPVPIKAKYFVPLLIVAETAMAVGNFEWDNIAHYAHLGGMLFGYILIKIWQQDKSRFY